MSNFLTDDTKAILLLCGVFGKNCAEKPLTQTEYTALVQWLMTMKMRPSDLLQAEVACEAAKGSGINRDRLDGLLARGVQLGFSVEEWQRNGIWVMSRSDVDYPTRYKRHLKDKAPPLLFGVGNKALLIGGGVAIVGSRDVDAVGETFTRKAADACAQNKMPVVSGGARGVDQAAMNSALDAGGASIGILPENLLKKSIERQARHAIAEGRLLLISPYHPNAQFTAGNAMARNKLIYALADFSLVVSSDYKKGGTWTGALEELRRKINRPVFVRTGLGVPLGNEKLLEVGGLEWPETSLSSSEGLYEALEILSRESFCKQAKTAVESESLCDYIAASKSNKAPENKAPEIDAVTRAPKAAEHFSQPTDDLIYKAVLPILINALVEPVAIDHLVKTLHITKSQLAVWMNRAIEDGKVTKLSHPVRYMAADCANSRDALK